MLCNSYKNILNVRTNAQNHFQSQSFILHDNIDRILSNKLHGLTPL